MVVLVVDDDLHVQFFIWKLLKAGGFTVLTAGDGEAALQRWRNHPGPIDLLLTDLEMPGINGIDLYRTIAAERPEIRVIVMSGGVKAREQSEMAGVPFLQKPFSFRLYRRLSKECLVPPHHESAAAKFRKMNGPQPLRQRRGCQSQNRPVRAPIRQLPDQFVAGLPVYQCRKTYVLPPEPQQNLPRASKLLHLREDQLKGLLDTSIWIFLDFAVGRPAIADGQCEMQFTAPRFLADRGRVNTTWK